MSIAPQKSRDIFSSLPKLAPQELDETGQKTNFDETCENSSTIQRILWPEAAVPDQNADEFTPRDCFETTSLAEAVQANVHQKSLRIQDIWQPSPEGLNDNFKEVSSRKESQEGQSPSAFPDYSPGDLLDLEKYDAPSFNDDYSFDTRIDDSPWNENASLLWGDDAEYPMTGDDAVGIMKLAEVEKVMTEAEGTSIAEGFVDAGDVFPSLSTENTCMIEPDADDPWEVDDLFIESLQADWNDSEPQENLTENGSFAFCSPPPAPKLPPCSRCLDSVGGVRSESLYDDDDLDRELLNLETSDSSKFDGPLSSTPPSSPGPASSPKILPLEKPMPQADMPHAISFDADGKPLPFIRAPFAKPVRDRPVIHALHSQPVLRTCFRIGEALNAGCAAVSSDTDCIIELYARVSSSTREPGTYKQRFRFADLFTADKPPFLTGVYTLWRGVELWEHGSRVFLGEAGKGRMARVVGRMRKEEGNWMMAILCVWEVD